MFPLLTISAGFESIEMPSGDVYSARYSAAAIHRNHQKKESHFVVDGGPWGETVCGISLMSSTIFHGTYWRKLARACPPYRCRCRSLTMQSRTTDSIPVRWRRRGRCRSADRPRNADRGRSADRRPDRVGHDIDHRWRGQGGLGEGAADPGAWGRPAWVRGAFPALSPGPLRHRHRSFWSARVGARQHHHRQQGDVNERHNGQRTVLVFVPPLRLAWWLGRGELGSGGVALIWFQAQR
jgi:hypothetical protein